MDNKNPAFTIEKIPTSSGSRTPDDPLRVEAKASDFLPVRTEALTSRAIDERTEKFRKKNNLPVLVHSQISDSNAVSLWYIHCFQRILLFRTYLNIFRGKLGDKTSKA